MNSTEDVIRVLLVDDDEDDRELFLDTLKELDQPCMVEAVSNSEQLFQFLKQKQLPHMIFMDINMPLPNGLESLKILKADAQLSHIPVLMYSLSSSGTDIDTAYNGGAHYYIVKPHTTVNLKTSLNRALAHDWRKPQPVPERNSFVIDISF